jgi:putative membrane protein
MYLSDDQVRRIQELGDGLELRTGVEVLVAVVGRCDSYPEIPWKAFALGASLGALAAWLGGLGWPAWTGAGQGLAPALAILGPGVCAALLTAFWPAWARIFLDGLRAEAEVRQYAQAFFLERELSQTRRRTGLLLLVGLFERRVVVLPDRGVAAELEAASLATVIRSMVPPLRRGDSFQALTQGMAHLETVLREAGFKGPGENPERIPEALVQHKGVQP